VTTAQSQPSSSQPPPAHASSILSSGPGVTVLPSSVAVSSLSSSSSVGPIQLKSTLVSPATTSTIQRATGGTGVVNIIQETKTLVQQTSSAHTATLQPQTVHISSSIGGAGGPTVHPIVTLGSTSSNIMPGGAGGNTATVVASGPATGTLVQPISVINSNNVAGVNSNSVTIAVPALNNASGVGSVGQQGQLSVQQQQQNFQRLKVEDALSYLDQVKFKFNNQPQVYNDFLDIMKEFKSQAIDTPGVIQRVSTLFRGHPELIVGFNTFLPPGYKIEMHANEQVSVSMPSSTVIIQSSGAMTTTPLNQQQAGNAAIPIHFTGGTPGQLMSAAAVHNAKVPSHPIHAVNSNSIGGHSSIVGGKGTPNVYASSNASAKVHHLQESCLPNHHGGGGLNLGVGSAGVTNGGGSTQPVEFNHAINYVNKIKNRFVGQPEVYKQFLEILHTYQKEQKIIKDARTPDNKSNSLTESEVYAQVAKLFQNQDDLLQEFGQFLPDANSASASAALSAAQHVDNLAAAHRAATNDHGAIVKKPLARPGILGSSGPGSAIQVKRLQTAPYPGSMNKRIKMTNIRDVSLAEAGKHGSLNEFAFFDKVRKALRNQAVYEDFLRCLVMYNHEVVNRLELVHLVTPFLGKYPELLKWFKDFLGHKEGAGVMSGVQGGNNGNNLLEGLAHRVGPRLGDRETRMTTETGMEIDYATCKRYGASYRALPKNYPQPKCSGRTPLCREVLNDTWVSFPSWSEDSTFVTSKKTQYEEYISKCEDERYELDVVIESNLATIRVLEAVEKKLQRMPPDERSKFKLDDNLGGTSTTIHQRAMRRIYGDKAPDIIDGLKRNPLVAVPIVLRRLKMKEEEWREAQKSFNKIWREQNERYYLKSLDHQGISFKQNDIKLLRSKNLLNEIETIYEERHEAIGGDDNNNNQNATNGKEGNTVSVGDSATASIPTTTSGPHIFLHYKDKSMIEEACNLIIHHIKRQTSIHKEDKEKIKQLMRHFIPDLFSTPRGELSDDDLDELDFDREDAKTSQVGSTSEVRDGNSQEWSKAPLGKNSPQTTSSNNGRSPSPSSQGKKSCDEYALFFGNNNWYLFFRLHNILCDRLGKVYERSQIIAAEEAKEKSSRKESTAIALRLKPKNEIEVEDYFPVFIDMIKQVLDGNLDGNQYEDMLREMFGIHAYIAFTMDKVVQNICRQLQHITCDETAYQCTELYIEELKTTAGQSTGGPVDTQHLRSSQELAYQKKAEQIVTDENCFKMMFYKQEGKVTIELLDTESPESDYEAEMGWVGYIERYVRGDSTITDELKERLCKKPVFLPRNIAPWRRKAALDDSEEPNDEKEDNDKKNNGKQRKTDPSSKSNNNNNKEEEDREDDNKSRDEPEKMDVDADDKDNSSPSTATASSNGEENKEKENGNEKNNKKSLNLALKDLDVQNSEQCRFNVNSFKMCFLVEGETFMYRRNALPKARTTHKKVSRSMFSKFDAFHSKWLQEQGDPEELKQVQEWLDGLPLTDDDKKKGDDSGKSSNSNPTKNSSRTIKKTEDREDSPPFRSFNRYLTKKTGDTTSSNSNSSS